MYFAVISGTDSNAIEGEPPVKKIKESLALDIAADELRATYQTQSSPAQKD